MIIRRRHENEQRIEVYGYITKYFEALHTVGERSIEQDIDDYISSVTRAE